MKLSRTAFIIVLIVFNIAIDQISKVIVRAQVIPGSESEILGDYLTLHNVENTGAFLGMGSDFNPTLRLILLLILPIGVLGYVLYYIIKNKTLDRLSLIGFCCIIGGGIANVYDRIMYGSVTDFLHIDLGGVFRTGIFNVADMSVMLGMGLLLYSNFKTNKKEKASN
ncbi:signal peptidase II [Hanstruepera ponticola]|uniref:signal peptidase II n=1 Tax=Hanstruepera ponticola TaxID=2042995 RepID=UPI000CF0C97C|nr:signal peptidase II [Hanstruepera ponticola]